MILFSERKAILRQNALDYISQALDSNNVIIIKELHDYFENNGELQLCTIKRVEKTLSMGIVVYHEGNLNDSEDFTDISLCSTDLLCNIVDYIHLSPLKSFKNGK